MSWNDESFDKELTKLLTRLQQIKLVRDTTQRTEIISYLDLVQSQTFDNLHILLRDRYYAVESRRD